MEAESTTYIEISPYQEILSGMGFILSISNGVIKLTGPRGVGKTRLLQRLHRDMKEEKQEMVLFFTPPVSPEEIETAVRRQLRLDRDLPFAKALTLAILAKPFDQQRLIVVFDEVEQIDQDTLLSATRFLEISHNQQPLISLVLCGDDSANERLAQPAFRPLADDLLLSYELNPLTKEQLQLFARALLPSLGLKPFDIRNGVLDRLYADSAGLPGAVPVLLQALAQDATTTTAAPVAVPGSTVPATEPAAAAGGPARWQLQLQHWQKPLQASALAAGLVVASVVAWPRLSPLVMDTWRGIAGGSTPQLLQPAPPPAPAPQVAATAPAEPVATPAPATPAEPATEPAAPVTEPAPDTAVVTAEPAPQAAPAVTPDPVPLPTPAPASSVAVTSGSAETLEPLVRQWLDAWQRQDLDAFFSFYHTDFAPLYQSTRADWQADRQRRISRPASIAIELQDFSVGTQSTLGTTVSFRMIYRSPTYADSTLKEVLIGPDVDGQWRILQEFNRDVAVLPRDSQQAQIAAVNPGTQPAPASTPTPSTIPEPAPANVVPVLVQPGPSPLATPRNVTPPQPDESGIGSFIAGWLDAWQNQDVDGYFSHYAPGYKPASMPSITAWREDRILKITRPRAIRLQIDALEIMEAGTQTARLEVLVEYHSTHYADRTLKEIELGRTGNGAWVIVGERNRSVETLPLVRLLTADAASPPATTGIALR